MYLIYGGSTASKQPLQFGHGCGAVEMGLAGGGGAGIGGLQFGHGCGAVEMPGGGGCGRTGGGGFNSATAAEPWRCAAKIPSRLRACSASIRPRLRSRGDRMAVARSHSRTCWRFNSATAAEPWRSPVGESGVERMERASIRPRLRSRGDSKVTTSRSAGLLGFNSATAAEPWRCAKSPPLGWNWRCFNSATAAEPWRFRGVGHRHPAQPGASIRPRLRSRGDAAFIWLGSTIRSEASIRPRLRSRGDDSFIQCTAHQRATLQFGHGCGAVEMGYRGSAAPGRGPCFNSATAAEPWR